MKYPKDIGPQSQTEFYALLFTMLGNAYNTIAQYEAEEAERDKAMRRKMFEEDLAGVREDTIGKRQERFRSEAAHREDEA